MTTWRKLLSDTFKENGENFIDIEHNTLSDTEMDMEFDDGFGSPEGKPFTVWTKKRVYFLIVYDGAESIESVSRNPDGKQTRHFGGY